MSFETAIEYNLMELPGERKLSFLSNSPAILSDDHDDDDDIPELLIDTHEELINSNSTAILSLHNDDLPELLVDNHFWITTKEEHMITALEAHELNKTTLLLMEFYDGGQLFKEKVDLRSLSHIPF